MSALSAAQSNAVENLVRITPVARRLGDAFAAVGHELYLVGGSVRDCLLGHLGNDLDLTTSARPDETEAILRSLGRTTWDMGREFGTIGCMMDEWQVEITTFRADTYHEESRKPEVRFGDSLTEDLVRRDFTVNAMAINVMDNSFVDPFGGLGDLASQLIRTPGAAEMSFSDDPLRMMRAARFCSQLGFTPHADVVAAMTDMADRIEIISAERVRDELAKLILTDDPRPGLDLLVSTGLADRVIPEVSGMRAAVDEHMRHKDVYEHSMTVLEQAIALEKERGHEPNLIVRLAALMHDVGKPSTRRFEDGKVTFHHHDLVGAKMTRKRLKALRFSAEQVKQVSRLVELHLRFHGYGEGAWTDSAVRRYVRDANDLLELLHILTRADCTTRNQRKAGRLRRAYDELERRIGELAAQEELDAIRPDLDGEQIMAILGLTPSREVGEAYAFLLERRMEEGPLGPERAEAELRAWWAQRQA